MASIVYLYRVPRYRGISIEEIREIESFLHWRQNVSEGKEKDIAESYKEWCGHSMKVRPPLKSVEYFIPYFEREHCKDEYYSKGYACFGIFECVARICKASQFLEWIMRNVLRTNVIPYGKEAYEVTRDQLEQLLEACNQVRRYGITCVKDNGPSKNCWEETYEVNEEIAKVFLPIREIGDQLMFPYKYETLYAEQVIDGIRVLNEILATTNFETQAIYFQC